MDNDFDEKIKRMDAEDERAGFGAMCLLFGTMLTPAVILSQCDSVENIAEKQQSSEVQPNQPQR